MEETRCTWPGQDTLMITYHDEEWGVPVHDDRKLFEYMVLDAMQAGLSWKTILYRRPGFKHAFLNFDVTKVSKFTSNDVEKLMQDASIIRNRLKIQSVITNAQAFIKIQQEFGTFDAYIWQFVHKQTITNFIRTDDTTPVVSLEAEQMSKDLRKRGFTFVGPTICYAFMQATGMVNDHLVSCFRFNQVSQRNLA